MNDEHVDEFHGQGGSYVIKDGKRVRVEEPTRDHPEGNRPRDSEGRPLDPLGNEVRESPLSARERGGGEGTVSSIRSRNKPATDVE